MPDLFWGRDTVNATASFIIIDKSDTTNYPHNGTGPIHIKNFGGYVKGNALADVKIEIGVIEEVDATDSTTNWFAVYDSVAADDVIKFSDIAHIQPVTPELGHVDYGTAAASTAKTATNTDFQTDVGLDSPYDAAQGTFPAAGDIVMTITVTAGSIDFHMGIEYNN